MIPFPSQLNPLAAALSPEAEADAPPPALLPYQQRWVADDSPLKLGEKSRRIGLTWAEASDDALIASAADGSNVFYISATQDMALEYIEAAAMWARAYDLAATQIEEGVFDDGDKEIKLTRSTSRSLVTASSRCRHGRPICAASKASSSSTRQRSRPTSPA